MLKSTNYVLQIHFCSSNTNHTKIWVPELDEPLVHVNVGFPMQIPKQLDFILLKRFLLDIQTVWKKRRMIAKVLNNNLLLKLNTRAETPFSDHTLLQNV